jgi:hypothetical protein
MMDGMKLMKFMVEFVKKKNRNIMICSKWYSINGAG